MLGLRRFTAPRFVPVLERLEGRMVPAGVVNATFSLGVLTLTAVNDPNDVDILGTNNQNIVIDGAGGNDITVTGNDGETGTAFTAGLFVNVTKIVLVMGLGDDRVTITDSSLTGNLVFKGGSGDNDLFVDGVNNSSGTAGASPGNNTLGNIKITNGDGLDFFAIGGGTNVINGSVTINNGLGGSETRANSLVADVTTIGGTVTVTNLDGADTFRTGGTSATFTGKVIINNGTGGSLTRFAAPTTTTLIGGISISNGAGNDEFSTFGPTFTVGTFLVRRNLTISNGTGDSDTIFQAGVNTIHGNLSVTNGAGFDTFDINSVTFQVTGTGSATVNNGVGGSDTFIDTGNSFVGGKLAVTAKDGEDLVDMSGLTVIGTSSFDLGSGNDTLATDNSTFAAFKLTAGAGADLVEIENDGSNNNKSTVFNDGLNINLGAGNDELVISQLADANDRAEFNAAVTLAGGLDLDIVFAEDPTGFATFAVPPIVTAFEQGL